MDARRFEAVRDVQMLPALLIDGLASIEEAIQSTRVGDITPRRLCEQLFQIAGISPSTKKPRARIERGSPFDTPKAVAAIKCLEAMVSSPHTRDDLVNFLWKGIGHRDQNWLMEVLHRLSWSSVITLLVTKPKGVVYKAGITSWEDALLKRVNVVPAEELVKFAQAENCFPALYALTRRLELLEQAPPVDRDAILSGDLGL